MGGGATSGVASFVNFTMPTGLSSNANGTYTISTAGSGTSISFTGTSISENGANGSPVALVDIVTLAKDSVYVSNP
jgi:hypothetical protein